jgi:hypothetical protein
LVARWNADEIAALTTPAALATDWSPGAVICGR